MLRFLTICVLAATLGVAGVLYKIKYDTRRLQGEAMMLSKQIANERRQLAVLKAEWSYLTRPGQIEGLAKSLDMAPLSPQQILSQRELDNLPLKAGKRLAKVQKLNAGLSSDGPEGDASRFINEVLVKEALFQKALDETPSMTGRGSLEAKGATDDH